MSFAPCRRRSNHFCHCLLTVGKEMKACTQSSPVNYKIWVHGQHCSQYNPVKDCSKMLLLGNQRPPRGYSPCIHTQTLRTSKQSGTPLSPPKVQTCGSGWGGTLGAGRAVWMSWHRTTCCAGMLVSSHAPSCGAVQCKKSQSRPSIPAGRWQQGCQVVTAAKTLC